MIEVTKPIIETAQIKTKTIIAIIFSLLLNGLGSSFTKYIIGKINPMKGFIVAPVIEIATPIFGIKIAAK